MNKKTLTKALAINVVVLVLVVALLGGLTFAWFSTRQTADTTQVIQVGNFAINLNDTPEEYVENAPSIKFMNAFPSTEAVANADDTVVETAGKSAEIDYLTNNKFAFSIENAGDINALLYLNIAVNGVNSEQLKNALRFNVYVKNEGGAVTYNEIKYNKSNTNAITFDGLKAELLKNINGGTTVNVPTSDSVITPIDSGLIAFNAKDKVEFAIVTWIDKDTEYGADADQVKGGDTFEFAVQIAAIQSVGGITKVDVDALIAGMPPQVWTTFYTFSDNVNTDETFTKEYTYKYTMNGIGVAPYLDNAKTGAYGNKIVINLNNASNTGKAATWTVVAENDSTVTADDIQADFNGTVVKGLSNIAAELNKISLGANANTAIPIIIWTENADDQTKLISLKFTATNTVVVP